MLYERPKPTKSALRTESPLPFGRLNCGQSANAAKAKRFKAITPLKLHAHEKTLENFSAWEPRSPTGLKEHHWQAGLLAASVALFKTINETAAKPVSCDIAPPQRRLVC
ncbi:MAG: hypothetical protein ABIR24_10920 [Verrucomicrobiota bacterium]